MYDYPLLFELNTNGLEAGMQVRDAGKQIVMYGSEMSDPVLEGMQPYQVVNTREEGRPVCQIQRQDTDEELRYTVTGPSGEQLGTVAAAEHRVWSVLDANGVASARVRERNGWRHSCLLRLIYPSTLESVLAAAFRMRYEVERSGLRVLELRELDSELRSHLAYRLKKLADLSPTEELLLLAALLVVLWSR